MINQKKFQGINKKLGVKIIMLKIFSEIILEINGHDKSGDRIWGKKKTEKEIKEK